MKRALLAAVALAIACSSPAGGAQPPNTAVLTATHYEHGWGWVYDGRLLVTTDAGDHWTQITLPAMPSGQTPPGIAVANPAVAWVAWIDPPGSGIIHVARTRTAGLQWDSATLQARPELARSVSLSEASTQLVWAVVDEQQTMNTDVGELFASVDGGVSWQSRHAVSGRAALFLASGRGFVPTVPGRTPWTTPDGGITWTRMPSGPGASVPAFADERHGIYGSGPEIYATADGGATWAPVAQLPAAGSIVEVAAASPTRWYARSVNPLQLWESTNSGRVWAPVAAAGLSSGGIDGLWFDGDTGWALTRSVGSCSGFKTGCTTRSELLRTRDGGRTWHSI